VAADVLADRNQLALRREEAAACRPPVRANVGCRRRSGSEASRSRSIAGPGWIVGAWTATSSGAPLPQIPHEELV
jgi:hypothetical protein